MDMETVSRFGQYKQAAIEIIKNAALLTRSALVNSLTDDMGNHDVDKECGYPNDLNPETLWRWFNREDLGYRMTVIKPETCWGTPPRVIENSEVEKTEFEQAFDKIVKDLKLWNYLERADIVSGVGDYGLLMIGVDDGKDFAVPIEGVTADGKGRAKKKLNVKYLRCFAQHQISIDRIVSDPKNPRFGQPEMYSLKFETENTVNDGGVSTDANYVPRESVFTERKVHWTRVIHLADNRDVSDVYGNSRLQRIYNRLIDIRKVVGGSAEMYWKGAFPGLSIETQPDFADAEFDQTATKEAIESYQDGLKRYLALQGVNIKSLEPQIKDPTANWKMLLMCVAICEGIPYRILLGVEEGKQAGNQDVVQWNDRMQARRLKYINPLILEPVIERFIAIGALPEAPYMIKWDELNEMTPAEKITNALNITKAMAEYMRGGVDSLIGPESFLKIFIGLDDEEIEVIKDELDGEFDLEFEEEESVQFDPNGNPGGQQNKIDENKV